MDFECNSQQRSNKLSLKLKCLKSLRKGFNKNKVPCRQINVMSRLCHTFQVHNHQRKTLFWAKCYYQLQNRHILGEVFYQRLHFLWIQLYLVWRKPYFIFHFSRWRIFTDFLNFAKGWPNRKSFLWEWKELLGSQLQVHTFTLKSQIL